MHALKALTGDATLDCGADAHMLAGGQGKLLDDCGDLAHLVSIRHPPGQLELCCVQQHLEDCQVADERVCIDALHLVSLVKHVLSKCMCTWGLQDRFFCMVLNISNSVEWLISSVSTAPHHN